MGNFRTFYDNDKLKKLKLTAIPITNRHIGKLVGDFGSDELAAEAIL